MDAPRQARLALALVIFVGLLLASGAVLLTMTRGDPVSPMFGHVITVEVMAALAVWSLLAWGARRVTIGKSPPKMPLKAPAALIWGSFRLSLVIGTVTVMACWLTAVALGLAAETAFARAVVLLVVVTVFTGATANAIYNSLLVLRRWRGRAA